MGHIHVIATQHLDVAWLWTRVPQGEDIMRQCFERAIAMIEAYPHIRFVFSRSTAWSFWIVQQRYPYLFEKIHHYVQTGQIELCGGEWVEPDHLIPSGESLVRQSILGQWYFQETFGKIARVCWDPDIFGHAHTLPQIIKKSGMDGYYFHRCRPQDETGNPLHQFIWEGPDGSQILILSGQWVGKPDSDVGQLAAKELGLTKLPATHVVTGLRSDRRITMQVDWVTLPGVIDEAPDLPSCSWSSAGDVLAHMQQYQDRLPVIQGELTYQYTGTYTSNGYNKRTNRKVEELLLSAEKVVVMASYLGFPNQEEQLTQAWRDLCVNQFHDIICGTCYQEVHVEDRHLFAEAQRRASWVRDQALSFMGDRIYARLGHRVNSDIPYAVFDFSLWPRRVPVVIPAPDQQMYAVIRADGHKVLSQPVTDGDGSPGLLIQHTSQGVGYDVYRLTPHSPAQNDQEESPIASFVSDNQGFYLCLENDLVRVKIDPENGEIVEFLDKRSGEHIFTAGNSGNQMLFLRDGGLLLHGSMHSWEPWNIMYTGDILDAGAITKVKKTESGPLRGSFRLERHVKLEPDMPETVIIQDIVLHQDSPLLTFNTHGTWYARQTMLKTVFALPFDIKTVSADVPYGTAERSPHISPSLSSLDDDTLAEDGQTFSDVPPEPDRYMQKWLDVSDGQRGLLFVNNGLYGYDAGSRTLRLSLLRAPYMRPELDEVIGLGPFSFAYAMMPHKGNWREVDAPREGYKFNIAPVVVPVQSGRNEGVGCGWWDVPDNIAVSVPKSFCTIIGEGVLGTVMKQAHDGTGIILRLFESLGHHATAHIEFSSEVIDVKECDFLERVVGEGPCSVNGHNPPSMDDGLISVLLSPYEIKTLRVQLSSTI
jgi:alpha-mannosidase